VAGVTGGASRPGPTTNRAGSTPLRNVGAVNARDVTLTGDYKELQFLDGPSSVDVAAGQARLFSAMLPGGNQPGEIHVTWTPELPDAEPLTWTEVPPPARQ
jgi:hypothetical protein